MTDGSRAAIVSVAARAVVTGRRAVAAPRPVVEILGRDAYPAAMADHASVVRPSRLGSQLLTLVPLGAAIALPYLAGLSHPFATLVGVFGFLAFRIFVVRFGLCRDHRRGEAPLGRQPRRAAAQRVGIHEGRDREAVRRALPGLVHDHRAVAPEVTDVSPVHGERPARVFAAGPDQRLIGVGAVDQGDLARVGRGERGGDGEEEREESVVEAHGSGLAAHCGCWYFTPIASCAISSKLIAW